MCPRSLLYPPSPPGCYDGPDNPSDHLTHLGTDSQEVESHSTEPPCTIGRVTQKVDPNLILQPHPDPEAPTTTTILPVGP